jgi:phosphomannomutase
MGQKVPENNGNSNQQQQQPTIKIALGQDPRPHGKRLADAFARGAEDSFPGRVQVLYTGVATTPACASFARLHGTDAGVMVTASHLPIDRNGFKMFRGSTCLSNDEIAFLGSYASQCAVEWYTKGLLPPTSGLDAVMCHQWVVFMPAHADSLKRSIQREVRIGTGNNNNEGNLDNDCLKGLTLVLNAGHGSGGFFNQVLKDMGANVEGSIGIEPDSEFPLGIPNPEYKPMIDRTIDACQKVNADLGIMLDTDADRCGFVVRTNKKDEQSGLVHYEPLNRNRLIALLGVILAGTHPGAAVVTDSVTSEGLAEFLEDKLGLRHVRYLKVVSLLARQQQNLQNNDENGASLLDLISEMKELDVIAELRIKTIDESLGSMRQLFDFCSLQIESLCYSSGGSGPNAAVESNTSSWSIDTDNLEGIRIRAGDRQFFMLRKSLHDPIISLQIEATNREEAMRVIINPLLKLFESEEQIRTRLDLSALKEL